MTLLVAGLALFLFMVAGCILLLGAGVPLRLPWRHKPDYALIGRLEDELFPSPSLRSLPTPEYRSNVWTGKRGNMTLEEATFAASAYYAMRPQITFEPPKPVSISPPLPALTPEEAQAMHDAVFGA